MAKKLFLVVLYHKGVDDSETLRSLNELQVCLRDTDLFVWDNSEQTQLNRELLKRTFHASGQVYFNHDRANSGLSKIYNRVIDSYAKEYDYFVWLDHDTMLTKPYLEELNMLTGHSEHGLDLILPRIYDSGQLISPARIVYFFGSYFKKLDPGPIPSKNLMAINSGMIISSSFFQRTGFRYNQELGFYGTDNDFMRTFGKHMQSCYVMEAVLNHTLNYYDTDESLEKKAKRFREIMRAVTSMYKGDVLMRVFSYLYVYTRSLKECVRHRSLMFLYR